MLLVSPIALVLSASVAFDAKRDDRALVDAISIMDRALVVQACRCVSNDDY